MRKAVHNSNAKAKDPYSRLFKANIPLSMNTDLRPDLTPDDLIDAGYVVRPHRFADFWCWWYLCEGSAESFGEPRLDLEAVYASARWHMGSTHEDAPPNFESIDIAELKRWTGRNRIEQSG